MVLGDVHVRLWFAIWKKNTNLLMVVFKVVQLHRSGRLKVSSGLYVRTCYLMDWFYKQKDFYNHSLLYYTVNYNELVYIMYIWRVTALCLFTFITLYLYLLMTFLGNMKETLVLSSAWLQVKQYLQVWFNNRQSKNISSLVIFKHLRESR